MVYPIERHSTLALLQGLIANTEFAGHTFVAGGFVRDFVMGRPSKDIDIVVDLPDGGVRLAELVRDRLGATDVHMFERFGTAQLVLNGQDIEFVMARKESYEVGSRKPEVEAATIMDDVLRRDFTINTLLINVSTGEVLDMTGRGISDIKDGVIRTTQNPEVIFGEDPLRMMRAIRFSSQLGFKIDEETLRGIAEQAESLDNISKERIRDEFLKMLSKPSYRYAILAMIDTKLMDRVLPELNALVGLEGGKYHIKNVFEHTMDVVGRVPETDPVLRLAALLHDIGKAPAITFDDDGAHFYGHDRESVKIAKEFMTSHKFSAEEIRDVTDFIGNHMRFLLPEPPSPKLVRRVIRELGRERFDRFMQLVGADVKPNPRRPPKFNTVDEVMKIVTEDDNRQVPMKPPVNGIDVMERFNIVPGPEVGRRLQIANDYFLEHPEATKEELLGVIEKAVAEPVAAEVAPEQEPPHEVSTASFRSFAEEKPAEESTPDLEELKKNMDEGQRRFFELMEKKEPLDPELEAYRHDTGSFEAIQHPLVYCVLYSPQMNAYLNESLRAKKQAVEEARAKGDWITYIAMHERPHRINAFLEMQDEMSDEDYWKTLGELIVDTENAFQWDELLPDLLNNDRPGREFMMNDEERKAFESLPEVIKIYRGCTRRNKKGWSWTTDRKVAEWFANRFKQHGAMVVEGEVNKDDVIAHWLGRSESEIFVEPDKVRVRARPRKKG